LAVSLLITRYSTLPDIVSQPIVTKTLLCPYRTDAASIP